MTERIPEESPAALGEHIASTLVHAVTCSILDPFTARISSESEKFLAEIFYKNSEKAENPKENFKEWLIGEVVGDYAAVPIVVLAQTYFPNFMQVTGHAVEPLLKRFIENNAEKSAKSWARHHKVEIGSERFLEKKETLYERALNNLSKTIWWTVSSTIINVCTQRALGNDAPLWNLLASKAVGALTTGTVVTGARASFPDESSSVERFIHHKVVNPLGSFIKKILDNGENKEQQSWGDKTMQPEFQMAR